MAIVGISGSYGGLNMGDEAIFTCITHELLSALPKAEITVFSRNAEYTRQHYPVARVIEARQKTREEIIPEVQRLDLLILGGGGILFDELVHDFLREVKLAQQLKVPTFAYAIGAGPLKHPEARQAVRETLNYMEGITVREIDTKRLLEEVGIQKEILVTADPAWLLEPEPFTDEMLIQEGINADAPLVGFSVREPGGAAPGLSECAYHKLLADAADYVVRRFDADVIFVPMERKDIRHAHQVISQMMAAERASIIKRHYRACQILGLIKRFEMVVGMRLHVLIFAATSFVPFLALPYASKVTSFLRKLRLPEQRMVQEGRVGPLLADIDWLWDNRHKQREVLAERVPPIRELARQTSKLSIEAMRRFCSL